jgi:hypothetical protein
MSGTWLPSGLEREAGPQQAAARARPAGAGQRSAAASQATGESQRALAAQDGSVSTARTGSVVALAEASGSSALDADAVGGSTTSTLLATFVRLHGTERWSGS